MPMMEHEVATGCTFAPDEIGWIDFELKSSETIKAGTYRYMDAADALICSYALGDGEVQAVAVPDFVVLLVWDYMPVDFRNFHRRVVEGKAKWAAWNASFDKAAWNYGTLGFPPLEAHHIIDVMAQAAISGLPPSLKMAGRYAGVTAKVDTGKDLIKLFCLPGSTARPETHPGEWAEFIRYAKGDITTMREVFRKTRQLPMSEWNEYWAMEKINERGVGIDLEMVKHAGWLAHEDKRRSGDDLLYLTEGEVSTVDQVTAITAWLLRRLSPEGREIILKREEEIEDGVTVRPAKYQLTRKQVERLIAFNKDETIDRVLQIRLYGGSKTPAKFHKIDAQQVGGVLYGQYVFAGAAQTGRASSKGVQVHNLARDTLPYEHDAIEAILARCSYADLAKLGDRSPVARKLSLLIRPAFVPVNNENVFVWSDWSNIEARITPWLADYLTDAAARLDVFRAVDADPSIPDIYTRTAAQVSAMRVSDVTPAIRQRGKVVELALGFLGGVGALHAMAASYGMHFSDEEARDVVERWRADNPWAQQFGADLWDAMLQAREVPCELFPVGRVGFTYRPDLLGGSMLMWLPSGRLLTYRAWRWEQVAVKDEDDIPTGEFKTELTYGRGHGRMKLWKGILVENATQAVAADVLRGTLVRLGHSPVRLHTHDEVLVEVPEGDAEYAARTLRATMRLGFEWSKGLPLMSEETVAPYYTKQKLPKLKEVVRGL
jgi:DNA polymerase bacteriophage-type